MKIKCNNEDMKKGFHAIENIVSNSNIKPILQNVKIEAKDNNTLELSATDLEISVNYVIKNVTVDKPGIIVCAESKIASIIREWVGKEIEILEEDKKCSITGEGGSFKILGMEPEEFPVIPKFIDNDFIEIDKNVLIDMIKKTVFVIASDKTRQGSNGIFFDINSNMLKMVAIDGRRLAEVKKKINNPKDMKINCVIPVKGIMQIQRVLSEEKNTVKINIDGKRIIINTENLTLCSQLIEAQFPDYEEVIPTGLDKKVVLEKEIFFSAVKRSAIMTTDEYKLLRFRISNNILELKCSSPDVGESVVEVPVEYSGEEVEMGLNPDFILDFSKAVEVDKVVFELKDSETAGVFRVGKDYVYVVMTMDL